MHAYKGPAQTCSANFFVLPTGEEFRDRNQKRLLRCVFTAYLLEVKLPYELVCPPFGQFVGPSVC